MKNRCTDVTFTHEGENGFEYVISYKDGYVLLKAKDCDDGLRLSTHDWMRFCSIVCPEIDVGRADITQWVAAFGSELYRMETNCSDKENNDFIFFKRCVEEFEDLHPKVLVNGLNERCHETVFITQWCDWPSIRKIFEEIDNVVEKFPAASNGWRPDTTRSPFDYWADRKKLFVSDADEEGEPDRSADSVVDGADATCK